MSNFFKRRLFISHSKRLLFLSYLLTPKINVISRDAYYFSLIFLDDYVEYQIFSVFVPILALEVTMPVLPLSYLLVLVGITGLWLYYILGLCFCLGKKKGFGVLVRKVIPFMSILSWFGFPITVFHQGSIFRHNEESDKRVSLQHTKQKAYS